MPAITNASEEAALADKYPHIRLFTVGQKTSSKTPIDDLQTIEQPWAVANSTSVAGGGGFGYFSAVCWIFGREVHDALGGDVPVGLISNNWGGTPVESWSTPATLAACNVTTVDSTLYNAMIHPYVVTLHAASVAGVLQLSTGVPPQLLEIRPTGTSPPSASCTSRPKIQQTALK